MDAVRELIIRKLEEQGISMKDASLRIGRNEAYVYDFIARGRPLELRDRDREGLSQVLKVLPDELRLSGRFVREHDVRQ